MIEFEHVSKRFIVRHSQHRSIQERFIQLFQRRTNNEEFWALRDISFRLDFGESLGLVGHNGAGKSTALKLITRILQPTSGTVRTKGRIAALLELGSGFHPELTGRENVFLYGSLMGLNRRDMEARLDGIFDFADIGAFVDTAIKHYSSGMYTRLAFAVATAVDPDILITDEVLAVGDEAFQRKCVERIYSFHQMGRTIIFVSHALDVVRNLCNTAIWLDHGVARAVGPANEVVDAYLADVNRRERAALQLKGEEITVAPEETFSRFGSREVTIVRVELLDDHEEVQASFVTGGAMTVRMHYVAPHPVNLPVFGIGLYHENGFWIMGPNTRFAKLAIPTVVGEGYVDCTIANLPLLTGRYWLSVAVYDYTMLQPYDHHERAYKLVVHSPDHAFGTVRIPTEWRWHGMTTNAMEE